MAKGLVKEYNSDRGYGIIIDCRTGWQHMIYARQLKLLKGQILKMGQLIEFDITGLSEEKDIVNVRVL
jgi:cold shock CspA family protein